MDAALMCFWGALRFSPSALDDFVLSFLELASLARELSSTSFSEAGLAKFNSRLSKVAGRMVSQDGVAKVDGKLLVFSGFLSQWFVLPLPAMRGSMHYGKCDFKHATPPIISDISPVLKSLDSAGSGRNVLQAAWRGCLRDLVPRQDSI
jgi:hypothetical protein